MIKNIEWKWLANEKETGKYIVLFNHIILSKGKWEGYLWNVSTAKKKGYIINFYCGRFVISYIGDDYKTYLEKCNCEII